LGLHSYLSYLRDRLLVSRELLRPTGSVFVQISDENQHHVRELMDEIFGVENFVSMIGFLKTSGASSKAIPVTFDCLLWYCRDIERLTFHQLYVPKVVGAGGATQYTWGESPSHEIRPLTGEELADLSSLISEGWRIFAHDNLTSQSPASTTQYEYEFQGKTY